MLTNTLINVENLKSIQELEEERRKELGGVSAQSVYFTTEIQKSNEIETLSGIDNYSIGQTSIGLTFSKGTVQTKNPFQKIKDQLSNYLANKTEVSVSAALISKPIIFNLKTVASVSSLGIVNVSSNKTNEANEAAASYQEEVDQLTGNEETKKQMGELLDQIFADYAKAHGKDADDLTKEEKIEAINQYVEDHVGYEWEEKDSLGSLEEMLAKIAKGEIAEGDCEEIAILKAALLETAGIDAELGFTGSNGTIDHVVVIVEGKQILNTTGAEDVTFDDIILKTSHDQDGNVVVTDKEGKLNTQALALNTHSGSDGPEIIITTKDSETQQVISVTVKNPDGSTLIFDGQNAETKANDYIETYNQKIPAAQAEAKEKNEPVMVTLPGPLGTMYGVVLPDGSISWYNYDHYAAQAKIDNWIHDNADVSYLSGMNTPIAEDADIDDVAQALEDEAEATTNAYDERHMYSSTENGAHKLDPDRIFGYMHKLMTLFNLLRIIAMLKAAKEESRALIHEEMTGMKSEYSPFAEAIINKTIEGRMTCINVQVQETISHIAKYNEDWFREKTDGIKDAHNDKGDQLYDIVSSGGNQREYWEEMGEVSGEYLEAVEAMADSMNAMVQAQSNVLKAKDKNGDMDALLNSATKKLATQLKDIVKKSDQGKREGMGVGDWFAAIGLAVFGIGFGFSIEGVGLLWNFVDGIRTEMKKDEDESYLEADMTKLDQLKDSFTTLQNTQRALLIFHGVEAETRNLIHEEMTGIGGRRSRKDTVMKIYEEQLAFDKMIFDTTASLNLQKIQVHNLDHYFKLQLDKVSSFSYRLISAFSGIFRLAGLALAVAAMICKFIPVVAALAPIFAALSMLCTFIAGALQYAAVEQADSVDDEFVQPESTYHLKDDEILGSPENEVMENGLDNVQLKETDDEMKAIDTASLAKTVMQISFFQQLKRMYAMCVKEKHQSRKLVHMEMTGIGGAEASPMTMAIMEADFGRVQDLFASRLFVKQLQVENMNREKQQERQVEAARDRFLVGNLKFGGEGAGIGFIANGLEGMALGYAIGSLVGTLVADLMEFSWAEEMNLKSGLDVDKIIDKDIEGNSSEARLRRLELKILEEFLSMQFLNAGDGYKAMDTKGVIALKKKMQGIYHLRSAFIELQKCEAQSRSLIHQEMTGVGMRTTSDAVEVANRAHFEAMMKAVQLVEQFKEAQLAYANRINDAKKQMEKAWWKFGICLAVGIALGGASFGSSSLVSLIAPAMSLCNSIVELVFSVLGMRDDYGSLKKDKVEQILDLIHEKEVKEKDSKYANASAAQDLDNSVYLQIDEGLIGEIEGGLQVLNSAYNSYFSDLMEKVYRVKEALAKIQAQETESRNRVHATLTGIGGPQCMGEAVYFADKTIAMEIVGSLIARIEAMVQRQNQIKEAEKQMVVASITTGLAAISFILQCIQLSAGEEAKDLQKEVATENNKLNPKKFEGQTASAQDKTKAQEIVEKDQKRLGEINKLSRRLYKTSAILNFLRTITPVVVGAAYKSSGENKEGKVTAKNAEKGNQTGDPKVDKFNQAAAESMSYSLYVGRRGAPRDLNQQWLQWMNLILFQATESLSTIAEHWIMEPAYRHDARVERIDAKEHYQTALEETLKSIERLNKDLQAMGKDAQKREAILLQLNTCEAQLKELAGKFGFLQSLYTGKRVSGEQKDLLTQTGEKLERAQKIVGAIREKAASLGKAEDPAAAAKIELELADLNNQLSAAMQPLKEGALAKGVIEQNAFQLIGKDKLLPSFQKMQDLKARYEQAFAKGDKEALQKALAENVEVLNGLIGGDEDVSPEIAALILKLQQAQKTVAAPGASVESVKAGLSRLVSSQFAVFEGAVAQKMLTEAQINVPLYQEVADEQAGLLQAQLKQNPKLLDCILNNYRTAHKIEPGQELTLGQKIQAANEYVDQQVAYQWEEFNQLGDTKGIMGKILAGEKAAGDCEEIAIVKSALLKSMGVEAEMGYTVALDGKTIDHVVVLAKGEKEEIILDVSPNAKAPDGTPVRGTVTSQDIVVRTVHTSSPAGKTVTTDKPLAEANYFLNTHGNGSSGQPMVISKEGLKLGIALQSELLNVDDALPQTNFTVAAADKQAAQVPQINTKAEFNFTSMEAVQTAMEGRPLAKQVTVNPEKTAPSSQSIAQDKALPEDVSSARKASAQREDNRVSANNAAQEVAAAVARTTTNPGIAAVHPDLVSENSPVKVKQSNRAVTTVSADPVPAQISTNSSSQTAPVARAVKPDISQTSNMRQSPSLHQIAPEIAQEHDVQIGLPQEPQPQEFTVAGQPVTLSVKTINPAVVNSPNVIPLSFYTEAERVPQTQRAVQAHINQQAKESDPLTAPVAGNAKSTLKTQIIVNPAAADEVNRIIAQQANGKPVTFVAAPKQDSNASAAHLARAEAIEQAIASKTPAQKTANSVPISKDGVPLSQLSEQELVDALLNLRAQRDQVIKSEKHTEQIENLKQAIEDLTKALAQIKEGKAKVPQFAASKEEYEAILQKEIQSKTEELELLEKADKGDTKSKFDAAKQISEKTKPIVSALQDKVKVRLVQEGRIKPNMKEEEVRRIVEQETDRQIQKAEKAVEKSPAQKTQSPSASKTEEATIVQNKDNTAGEKVKVPKAEVTQETVEANKTVKTNTPVEKPEVTQAKARLRQSLEQKETLVQKAEILKVQVKELSRELQIKVAQAETIEEAGSKEIEVIKKELQKLDLNVQSYEDLKAEHKPESEEFKLITKMIDDAQSQKSSLTQKTEQFKADITAAQNSVVSQKEALRKAEAELVQVTAQVKEVNMQIAGSKAQLASLQGLSGAVQSKKQGKAAEKEETEKKETQGSAIKQSKEKKLSHAPINSISKAGLELRPQDEKPAPTVEGAVKQQADKEPTIVSARSAQPGVMQAEKQVQAKNIIIMPNIEPSSGELGLPAEQATEEEITKALVQAEEAKTSLAARQNQTKVLEQTKGELIVLEKTVMAVKAQIVAPPKGETRESYEVVLQQEIKQKEREIALLQATSKGDQGAKAEMVQTSNAKAKAVRSLLETKVKARLQKEGTISTHTKAEKAVQLVQDEIAHKIEEVSRALPVSADIAQKEASPTVTQQRDVLTVNQQKQETSAKVIPNINVPLFKDIPLEQFVAQARQSAKGQSLMLAYIDQIEKAMQTAQTAAIPSAVTEAAPETVPSSNMVQSTSAPVDLRTELDQLKTELNRLLSERLEMVRTLEGLKSRLTALSRELASKLPALEAQERAIENEMNKIGQKIIDIDNNIAKLRTLLAKHQSGSKEYELLTKMIKDYENQKEALFFKFKGMNAELDLLKAEADQTVKEMQKIKEQIKAAVQKLGETDAKINQAQAAINQILKAIEEEQKALKNEKNKKEESKELEREKSKERKSVLSSAVRSIFNNNGNGKHKEQKQKQQWFKEKEEEKEAVRPSGAFLTTQENDLYSQAAAAARAQKALGSKHNGVGVA